MKGDWLAVFEALKDCYVNDAFSNIAINEAVENHKDCSSGFVRAFAKGVLRDSMKLDYYIDNLASKGARGIKNRTLVILRMGLYAIESLDSVPEYAAVNEAVTLAKKVSRGSDRFVNALLRRFIRERDEFAIDDHDLVLKYSFPKEVVELLESQFGEETEKLLASLNTAPELIVRANLSKITRDELIAKFKEEGIECEACSESRTGIIIHGGSIMSTSMFREGLFTVQSLSSIKSIEAFGPKAGSKVLDMCAAPGGKTCAMAEMMYNEGSITACDIHPHRLELIQNTAARLGIDIVDTELLDGTKHRDDFDDSFDYVLCDVPCSGLGVIGSKPELKLRTNPGEYAELTEIQKAILENAYHYTKPGGRLMYSTCTINRRENDDVIAAFQEEHPFAQVIEKCLILPYNRNLVGFFYCMMEKPLK